MYRMKHRGPGTVRAIVDTPPRELPFAGVAGVAAHGTGAYVNFQGTVAQADLRVAYPPATLARLRAAKRSCDPGNLFARNLNIAPARGATV